MPRKTSSRSSSATWAKTATCGGRPWPRRRSPTTRSFTSTSTPTPTRPPGGRRAPRPPTRARSTCSPWRPAARYSTVYDAAGNSRSGPPVSYAVQGNQLLISADVDLGRDASGVHYALYVLCHTVTDSGSSPRMSDSSRKQQISGVPLSHAEEDPPPRRLQGQLPGGRHVRPRAVAGGPGRQSNARRAARPARNGRLHRRFEHHPALAAPQGRKARRPGVDAAAGGRPVLRRLHDVRRLRRRAGRHLHRRPPLGRGRGQQGQQRHLALLAPRGPRLHRQRARWSFGPLAQAASTASRTSFFLPARRRFAASASPSRT